MSHPYALADALEARKADPFGQFGQAHDRSTWEGVTGCGQTCVQAVLDIAKNGVHPTHDAISLAMKPQYWRPGNRGGTSGPQLASALRSFGMPYKAVSGISFADLMAKMKLGPVLFVVWYPEWPNWQSYAGRTRPTPWAEPLRHAGRNQFDGGLIEHWVLGLGRDLKRASTRNLAVMEPNHNSPARPQKVALDWVNPVHARAAYMASVKHGLNNLQAVIPTAHLKVA